MKYGPSIVYIQPQRLHSLPYTPTHAANLLPFATACISNRAPLTSRIGATLLLFCSCCCFVLVVVVVLSFVVVDVLVICVVVIAFAAAALRVGLFFVLSEFISTIIVARYTYQRMIVMPT